MDNSNSFEDKLARIYAVTGTKSDTTLAKILEIKPPSVAAARKRKQIPTGWIERIAKQFNVSADWLFFGKGEERNRGEEEGSVPSQHAPRQGVDLADIGADFPRAKAPPPPKFKSAESRAWEAIEQLHAWLKALTPSGFSSIYDCLEAVKGYQKMEELCTGLRSYEDIAKKIEEYKKIVEPLGGLNIHEELAKIKTLCSIGQRENREIKDFWANPSLVVDLENEISDLKQANALLKAQLSKAEADLAATTKDLVAKEAILAAKEEALVAYKEMARIRTGGLGGVEEKGPLSDDAPSSALTAHSGSDTMGNGSDVLFSAPGAPGPTQTSE
jgi:hypothetical protein